jgi:hypothetical protein
MMQSRQIRGGVHYSPQHRPSSGIGESREINFTTDAVPGVAPDSAMDGRGQTNGVDREQSEDDSGGALDAEKW